MNKLFAAFALAGALTFAAEFPVNRVADGCPDTAAKPQPRDQTTVVETGARIGARVGAVLARKGDPAKGAAIGAAVGSVAALIYDLNRSKFDGMVNNDPPPAPAQQ